MACQREVYIRACTRLLVLQALSQATALPYTEQGHVQSSKLFRKPSPRQVSQSAPFYPTHLTHISTHTEQMVFQMAPRRETNLEEAEEPREDLCT